MINTGDENMKKWIGGLTLFLLVCGVFIFIGYRVSTHTAQKMIRADGVKTDVESYYL